MCQRNKKLPLNTVVHDFILQIMLRRLEAEIKGLVCRREKRVLVFPPACEHGTLCLFVSV